MNYAMLVARRRPALKAAGATITFTQQPENQPAADGAATFSALAVVSDESLPAYQWQKQESGAGLWSNVSGATSPSLSLSGLTVAADNGDKYRVIASSPSAASVTSSAATLSVVAPVITITQQPTNQTAVSGDATFSVAAASSPAATLAYQWQRGALNFAAITPTQITAEEPWVNVAYGNGVFVAASSYRTAVARSSDGVAWATSGDVIGASADWRTIKYVGGLFVMPAYRSNQLPTSADGLTWNIRTLPSQGGSIGPFWNDVAYGNGVFVIIMYDSMDFARSTDGVNWSSAAVSGSPKQWWAVGHGAGKFVAISGFGETTNSANGQSWSAGPNLPSLPNQSTNGRWAAMTFGKDRFVAVASNTAIAATSDDGLSWTQRSLPATANWQSVSYGGGYFFALATGNVAATSQDGITWTQRTMPSSGTWAGAAFGGDRFAAVREWSQASAAVQTSWAAIGGATSSTLALTGLTSSNDQDQYRAVVSAANATPVTSSSATLTVN